MQSSTQTHSVSGAAVPGLSSADVAARIQRGERNDFESRVLRSYWDIFRDNALNLFNVVLFSLLLLVALMGDYVTVFFAGFSVFTNTFLGMIQEMNAKRRLDHLASLITQQVDVWRDGRRQIIAVQQVVKDDVLVLEPGVKAVVDGQLIAADALEMDESLLTGESDAVFKQTGDEIWGGAYCIAGTGLMQATRVGAYSQVNRIAAEARSYKLARTPTQRRLDGIVELSILLMFVIGPMLLLRNLVIDNPALPLLQAVRNLLVFVTILVPQGLVLTAILSLTIGAIKISRYDTLVQKVNAVESLAHATILCFDKTGTLTRNHLVVEQVLSLNGGTELAITEQLGDYVGHLSYRNRTAAAIYDFTGSRGINGSKQREIPFTSGRKWGAVIAGGQTHILGAPEYVLPEEHTARQRAELLSQQGKRVLVFGCMDGELQNEIDAEQVRPIALVVMNDQIRDDIRDTLNAFRAERLQLKIISGDNMETVRAVAGAAGIASERAYAGPQIDRMSPEEIRHMVRDADIFARIGPQTKQRLIQAMQANGDYVAMIGDGVNDVPALKQADLAIVMNDGTQISKDIADIVLLNNAISTLPHAFAEGTAITQTIYATTRLFLTRSLFCIALFVCALFMGMPFPMTPIQMSWGTLGSTNIPATLLTLGLIRPQWMRAFRDDVLEPILTGGMAGTIMMITVFTITYLGLGRDTGAAQSSALLAMMLLNAYVVLSIQGVDLFQPRTFVQHGRVLLMVVAILAVSVWLMYVNPPLFEYTPLSFSSDPLIFVLLSACMGLAMALLAYGLRRRRLLHLVWRMLERGERPGTLDDSSP